ncbi:histidine kinase [Cytophagaceae bacterium BD1B2-1]|uniref:Histidine kinase n=2 Tax=Xanthocytophaga agilis TaxID=3048010 RepID=A0AAE3RDI9_9BACT|nr:histidine kinase [Xanthocytophaga agilis]
MQLLERIEKKNAELVLLKAQLNPHFLFNILNNLYSVALQDNSLRVAEGIQKLGDIMRFMLHDNLSDYIPLERELDYLKNYIQIQTLRLSPYVGISITTDLPASHCPQRIAPMLIIPFVENAFKHGISYQHVSWIHILLHCQDNSLRLLVKNSIHSSQKKDLRQESGVGLENVRKRLQLLYHHKHRLQIDQNENEFVVELLVEFDA